MAYQLLVVTFLFVFSPVFLTQETTFYFSRWHRAGRRRVIADLKKTLPAATWEVVLFCVFLVLLCILCLFCWFCFNIARLSYRTGRGCFKKIKNIGSVFLYPRMFSFSLAQYIFSMYVLLFSSDFPVWLILTATMPKLRNTICRLPFVLAVWTWTNCENITETDRQTLLGT